MLLTVSWIGSGFCGWQTQGGTEAEAAGGVGERPSLQATLADALFAATGEARLDAVSRTDAGVHAVAQRVLCSFRKLDFDAARSASLPSLLNAQLPPTVRVRDAELLPPQWSAREQCVSKRYTYAPLCPCPRRCCCCCRGPAPASASAPAPAPTPPPPTLTSAAPAPTVGTSSWTAPRRQTARPAARYILIT